MPDCNSSAFRGNVGLAKAGISPLSSFIGACFGIVRIQVGIGIGRKRVPVIPCRRRSGGCVSGAVYASIPPFQESGLALHWIGRAILQSIQEPGLQLARAFPGVMLVEEVVEALAQRLGNPQFLAPRRIDSRDDDRGV